MEPYALEVRNVCHWFGDHRVLYNVNVQIAAGQVVSIVGPSGCGKSTLLRAILGTHPPCAGEVYTAGKRVEGPCRDVGIVYQNYSLYEFLTAQQNVAFGPMLDQTNPDFRFFRYFKWRRLRRLHMKRAARLLAEVGLGEAKKLYPAEMSGGMRQRVAIAQALIMEPNVLLLDEPFGALDEATREGLQMMLLQLYQENLKAKARGRRPPHTILLVTHELNEAIYVAERVVGLSQYHAEGQQGATIVYDKAAPIFQPSDPREYGMFLEQKEELRRVVFEPNRLKDHEQYVSFWREYQKTHGVAQ